MSKKAKASTTFLLFFLAMSIFMGLRWIVAEPYVIPSGSMIPTLLVNDHILVTKFDFGIRIPYTEIWLYGPRSPQRGDVVVFKSKDDSGYFLVKRVIALPGELIRVEESGKVFVNNIEVENEKISDSEKWDGELFLEKLNGRQHRILHRDTGHLVADLVVPDGHVFLMGDNRESSSDSRVWGPLPIENLMGKARSIWLSCDETLSKVEFICDPRHIHWQRVFSSIE